MKQKFIKAKIEKLSKMLDDMIELDNLKATATEITCKYCFRGKYINENKLCDKSIEYFCNKCGHIKKQEVEN